MKRGAPTSQYYGVMFDKKRGQFVAKIRIDGKQIHLGCFGGDERAAAHAFNVASVKYHGQQFAVKNILTEQEENQSE
jgi:hypothetical protein